MTLPPIDPEVLSTHPKFDALYRDLCTNKLNPDGSTAVDEKAQKERDVFYQVWAQSFRSKPLRTESRLAAPTTWSSSHSSESMLIPCPTRD